MNLPDELIKEYIDGEKIMALHKKYKIGYNSLYFKLGELGIRRKELQGGYRGAYKRKTEVKEWKLKKR